MKLSARTVACPARTVPRVLCESHHLGCVALPPPHPPPSLSFLVVKMWKMAHCTGQLKGLSKKWAKSACESLGPTAAPGWVGEWLR